MTKFIDFTESKEHGETVFNFQITTSGIFEAECQPRDYEKVICIGFDRTTGCNFAAINEDCIDYYSGQKGNEFK